MFTNTHTCLPNKSIDLLNLTSFSVLIYKVEWMHNYMGYFYTKIFRSHLTARGFLVQILQIQSLSVWSLHVLPMHASLQLPPTVYDMHVRSVGESKLTLEVSVSVDGCLSRLSLCGPVMDWRAVQDVPCFFIQ